MKLTGLIAAAALLACAAPAQAVTLVDDSGAPIGGQFQAYADRAQVPTLAGTLIIRETNPACPVACSQGPGDQAVNADGSLWVDTPAYGPAITWAVPAAGEYQFDWELGHQFDWAYLTDDDRREFAAMWRDPTGQWWDSEAVLSRGGEDGLERVFAADYASCAMGYPPAAAAEPANRQQVCEMIDTIGQRAGAHMPPPLPPTAGSVTVTSQQTPHRSRQHRARDRASRLHARLIQRVGRIIEMQNISVRDR